jgi:hemerythrin superfamily protein
MTQQIDVIDLLEQDHRSIDRLAAELDATDDPAELRSIFLRIADELAAHEAAEREVLFPAFHAHCPDGDNALAHRIGEHEELNDLLAEMRSMAPDGFGFMKRASALLLDVKGHFLLEEESVFARMRAEVDADERYALGARALEAKRHAPAFPSD